MASGGSKTGLIVSLVGLVILGGAAAAYKFWPSFGGGSDDGPVTDKTFDLPFIFWGGDVATFHANGGLETKDDSIFGKHGLHLKLVPGDDFGKQVKDYMDNKTPFLRGTLSMLGQASDELTKSAGSTPVVFLQLTWSAGDHLVGRDKFKSLNDIKGKKIALQKGGPHVGMLNDILNTAKLGWRDITVVWTDEVSGDKGPAALFRKDPTVDGCFAISPEMFELTSAPPDGGVDSVGKGTDKSVQGAHVVVSTAHMSRSIADVYACRKDFFDKNKSFVQRLAAGYIKACEELVDHKKKEGTPPFKGKYLEIIKQAQEIWGKDPAIKDSVAKAEDVDGLISDATFVGLPGNINFFTNKGNLSGFPFKMQQALALPDDPSTQPLKTSPKPFLTADFKYDNVKKLGGLVGKAPPPERFKGFGAEDKVDTEKTIYSFEIHFEPNQATFPEAQYGKDFQRALEQASLFGNAVVAIRGHADPSLMVQRFLEGAGRKGLLNGSGLNYKYPDGKPFDLQDTKKILEMIRTNDLTFNDQGRQIPLKEAVKSLEDLSTDRAASVRNAVITYGQQRSLVLDRTQIREDGVGVRDPVVGFATTESEFAKNRRVEFRIIKVPADKVNTDEFEL